MVNVGVRLPARGLISAKGKKTIALTAMVLPGAVWLLLFRYAPMFGVIIGFKDFRLPNPRLGILQDIFSRDWVGFSNFKLLFGNPMTSNVIRNTLLYNITFIVLGTLIAVAFAIMLNEISHMFLSKVYQTAMFFPFFLSWVVVSYFLFAFISTKNGVVSPAAFGLVDFYLQPEPWPFILIVSYIWKMTGYSSLIYLAVITGIDSAQYEAASIDGASKWQQAIHITLPNLRPIIIILFIMNVGRIFNADFGQFWALPIDGGSAAATNATGVVDTYIYRLLRTSVNIGQSTAVGLFQNAIGFVCIMIANTVVRKVDRDSAMF
ncbi:MAG: ABC transporter permease subunit [Oscillospiraceae bacterium]|nr:ABC transporter permease subunit [Oscillospiraceae bacterium]